MTTHSTSPTDSRSARERWLDDMAELLAWLREHPEVPIGTGLSPISYCVLEDDDAVGVAAITALADAIGVPVTGTRGRPASDTETHLHAIYRAGNASYEATYIRRQAMADYDALTSYNGSVQGGDPR